MDRDEAIQRIRKALKSRSGKAWSVTGGRGTAWGWIKIDAPPARRTWRDRQKPGHTGTMPEDYESFDAGEPGHYMGPAEREHLAGLLGLESVHFQGVSIPASSAYYQEYVDRAEDRPVSVFGKQYWD